MKIGIMGTGQMATGIAQVASASGSHVCIVGRNLDRGLNAIEVVRKQFDKLISKQKMAQADASDAIDRIAPVSIEDLNGWRADIIIEAVAEDLQTKQSLIKLLNGDSVIATNTSSLSVTEIADAARSPSMVVGMHFFNPAPVMPLVEIVRGQQSSDRAVELATHVALELGKHPITVKDRSGFVVNRLLFAMLREACAISEQSVASIADIDSAIRLGLRHPMGPFELMDFIGLDVCKAIFERLPGAVPRDLEAQVMEGRLGKKSNSGFTIRP